MVGILKNGMANKKNKVFLIRIKNYNASVFKLTILKKKIYQFKKNEKQNFRPFSIFLLSQTPKHETQTNLYRI